MHKQLWRGRCGINIFPRGTHFCRLTQCFPAALVSTHARSNWPRLTFDSPMLCVCARVCGVHSNHDSRLRGKFLICKHVKNIKIMRTWHASLWIEMRIRIGSVPGVMRGVYIEMPGAVLTVFEYWSHDLNAFGTCYNAVLLGIRFKKRRSRKPVFIFRRASLKIRWDRWVFIGISRRNLISEACKTRRMKS